MPEITRFLGIIITMYFDEHEPLISMSDIMNIGEL